MSKILRVVYPQWQGGNRPQYYIGAKLLEWLAPETENETIEIPVQIPENFHTGDETLKDNVTAKEALLRQSRKAYEMIKEKNPDKLVIFGGDCSIEFIPFAYLMEKYGSEKTGILWIDSHLDLFLPSEWKNFHAHVMAALLGEGDSDFTKLVPEKANPENLVYAGVNDEAEFDREVYRKYKFRNFNTEELSKSTLEIIEEFKKKGLENIIVHFDLDVLSLDGFRSQYFAEIPIYDESRKKFPPATPVSTIVKLINDINDNFNMIGLGITEHLPWDAIVLKEMLEKLPLL